MNKKFSFVFLSFFLLFFSSAYAGFTQSSDSLGLVIMQAENYDSLRAGTIGDNWGDSTAYSGYYGSGYMQVDSVSVYNPSTKAQSSAPALYYNITFVDTGEFYIWTRKYFIDGSNDSFYYGLDDSIATASDMVPHGAYGVWQWVMGPTTIHVPTTGNHKLGIYLRERKSAVDEIVLTSSATFDPSTDLKTIAFVYDGSLIDNTTGKSPDQPTMDLLSSKGYSVLAINSNDLSSESQATINTLNNADLVIGGRTIYSSQVQGANKDIWNGIKAPLMVTSVYDVRSSRLGWFNSTSLGKDENTGDTLMAKVMLPNDDVFSDVTLTDSVMSWAVSPYETISVADAGNGTAVVKSDDGSIMLMARFDPWKEFYDGSGAYPAGYRTYMGNGYDGGGIAPWNYLSSYTDAAQSVFLNEVARMVNLPAPPPKPVGLGKTIAFVVLSTNIDTTTGENKDQPYIDALEAEDFNVEQVYSGSLETASQGLIDTLNSADLVVIGRSGTSSDFGSPHAEAWNAISSPLMLLHLYADRSNRLRWLNTTSILSDDNVGDTLTAKIELPNDAVFTGITLGSDSTMKWVVSPYDYMSYTGGGNGTVVARDNSGNILFERWDPWTEFYNGSGQYPAGYRTLIGNGNDHLYATVPGAASNYYNFTDAAKQVFLNEVVRMVNLPAPPPKPVGLGKTIAFVVLSTNIDTTTGENKDQPYIDALDAKGYKVEQVYNSALETDTTLIDSLDAADLVIIGRSGSSTDFGSPHAEAWNAVTSPLMSLHQYAVRSNRLMWMNTTSITSDDNVGDTLTAKIELPEDTVFTGITLASDSTMKWAVSPYDYMSFTGGGNGTVVARDNSGNILFERWDPWTEFYSGSGQIPAGYRTFIGNGNDHLYATQPGAASNYYNFTDAAKQVFLNEVARMVILGKVSKPTSVAEGNNNLPFKYALDQNYPNPFNPTTTIGFSVPKNSNVKINVYDILGRLVKRLVDGVYKAGRYKIQFNASDLASGVYFYRIEAGNFVNVKKLILLK